MSIPSLPSNNKAPDIYTDLNALQNIGKGESDDEALKKVAKQFESMFIDMMMKGMRSANAVFEKDSPFKSKEEGFYRDMYDKQLSQTMANGKGIGIADAMYRQMSRAYNFDQSSDKPSEGIRSLDALPALAPLSSIQSTQQGSELEPQVKLVPASESASQRIAIADSPESFIAKITPYAEKAAKRLGLDPQVLVAQAALETGWGKHVLSNDKGQSSHNLFNIKTGNNWTGDSVEKRSLEVLGGKNVMESSKFRVYSSIEQSFDDYVNFLKGGERYQQALMSTGDAKTYIQALQDAGYATDPKYAKKVIGVYDRVAGG